MVADLGGLVEVGVALLEVNYIRKAGRRPFEMLNAPASGRRERMRMRMRDEAKDRGRRKEG